MTEKNAKLTHETKRMSAKHPTPTVPEPDMLELLENSFFDSGCEATDGCWVETDGICEHGHPSWLLRWGMI